MSSNKISIVGLSIASRFFVIALQFIANHLISDHDAGVFISPKKPDTEDTDFDRIIEFSLGGFRRWDAEYFLHIAEHGYTHENSLAFYPFYPSLVRFITNVIEPVSPSASLRNRLLLTAIVLNVFAFVEAAKTLHRLTLHIYGDQRIANIAVILFCINPASIFFTTAYTESVFCCMSFKVMLACAEGRFLSAALPLAASMSCRSNGILNFDFIAYFLLNQVIRGKQSITKNVFKMALSFSVVIITFILIQNYFHYLFCMENDFEMENYVRKFVDESNFVLPGTYNATNTKQSPWCQNDYPFSYSYIQSHYWNVGFLKYYELKQIPNFVIGVPMLSFLIYYTLKSILQKPDVVFTLGTKDSLHDRKFVFMLHAFVLSIFCVAFIHIQVSTRMLASSSPSLYWLAAELMTKNTNKNHDLENCLKTRIDIIVWFISYLCIGTILYCNFLPWT